ncbi:MAG: guanylate kinase [Firmicutes bacterium]|nr:guanylate kinase [Bacillota bacterium]
MAKSGLLVVLSGPSGVGKGTVCKALLDKDPELVLSVSKTTRKPRLGEKEGVNYYFVGKEEFEADILKKNFLEYAKVYDHFYGTPRQTVEKLLQQGRNVILEIDPQGALQVMETYPNGVFIFLLPPSAAELRARIIARGTEDKASMQKRLAAAALEVAQAEKYKYVVVNDHIDAACDRIYAIIQAEMLKVQRNIELLQAFAKEVEK